MVEAAQTDPIRPPLTFAPPIAWLENKFRGADIVIVGNGPTGLYDYTALGKPLWVFNGGWQVHTGADLCFMMDDLEGPAWDMVRATTGGAEKEPQEVEIHGQKTLLHTSSKVDHPREYWEEITGRCPIPIITTKAYPEKFPQTVAYPIDEVVEGLGREYFAETVCYAAAWALHIGVKSILFGGCDYGGIRPAERAGLEYWIGRLEQAGIPCKIVPGSQLLSTGPLNGKNRHIDRFYGYTEWPLRRPLKEVKQKFTSEWLEDGDQRLGYLAMEKLLAAKDVKTVLDIGHGQGDHALEMSAASKKVTGVDPQGVKMLNDQHNGGHAHLFHIDYLQPDTVFSKQFDAVWCCHVLEHVDNPNYLLRKAFNDLRIDGMLAITVPPVDHMITGGHHSLWNAGHLLYQLVRAGFDCRAAQVRVYGHNLSVVVRKRAIPKEAIPTDPNYSVSELAEYLPEGLEWDQGLFNGDIRQLNWDG